MFTPENYMNKVSAIEFNALPEVLRKGHEFVIKATNNGNDWSNYQNSEAIKKVIDTYFVKLAQYEGNQSQSKLFIETPQKTAKKKTTVKKPKKEPKEQIKKEKVPKPKKVRPPKVEKPKKEVPNHTMVERIPDEVRIIKRFVNLNNKTKTKEEILNFINSLQKAILEKKIRKSSPHVVQIRYIQDKLIEIYESMDKEIEIKLKPETFDEMKLIADEDKVMPSVNFIKRYINLNGKSGIKEKAKLLLGQINRALDKDILKDKDPYIAEIEDIKKNLEDFVGETTLKILEIEKTTLNGLEGILGCACNSLHGTHKSSIMSSVDFANLKFKTIGFTGKWLKLIGDPSPNFTAMVFGKPKYGKSYLCIDFAGYLARHHGKVLYVAKEEGLDKTLQDKLKGKNVKHPNLMVAAHLPANLSKYDFIFLDSVTKLGLTAEDLDKMKHKYPHKSFIFIFQTTKDGNFRGANHFQHDVDVVIEVPEKGRAVQNGRFNQGGEISIF